MVISIAGGHFRPLRGVDDDGEVLDLLARRRRDKPAAVNFLRKLLKKQGFAPETMIADRLRSSAAAKAKLRLTAHHEQGLRKNDRAENSHSRRDSARERCGASSRLGQPRDSYPFMPRFKTPSTLSDI